MKKLALTKTRRGAVATGAASTGAASLGAMAVGALALGAMAIGAMAIGRLSVGRARLRRVEIGELLIGRLDVGATTSGPAEFAHIRAARGRGDALERFIREQTAASGPGPLDCRVYRSRKDSDLFLIHATRADGAAFDLGEQAPWLDELLRRAAERHLVLVTTEGLVDFDHYRTI